MSTEQLRRQFNELRERWDAGEFSDEDLASVFGIWRGYPDLIGSIVAIGTNPQDISNTRQCLNFVHQAAGEKLALLCRANGIDGRSIYSSTLICQRELFNGNVCDLKANVHGIWPDSFPISKLRDPELEIVLQSQMAVSELATAIQEKREETGDVNTPNVNTGGRPPDHPDLLPLHDKMHEESAATGGRVTDRIIVDRYNSTHAPGTSVEHLRYLRRERKKKQSQ